MINHPNHSAKFSLSLLLLAITLSGCRFGELDLWSAVSSSDESNAESHTTPEELKERWQVAFTALNDALSNKDSQLARRIYSEELEPVGLELAEISGDHYLAFILEANGAIALTSNNIEEALESYENAFSISLESDVDELSVAILASELGHCYRLNGDFEMAAEVLENAIDDMEEHDGAVANRMSAIADLYDCYLKLDDPEKTIDVLERGVATLLPLVSEEFDRIALMSGMVIELSKMTGDNERSQEYGELCRALDSDFQLDTNIRQMLVDSSVLGSTNDFRSQNQQQVLRPESSFAQQNENQQLVAEAQAE